LGCELRPRKPGGGKETNELNHIVFKSTILRLTSEIMVERKGNGVRRKSKSTKCSDLPRKTEVLSYARNGRGRKDREDAADLRYELSHSGAGRRCRVTLAASSRRRKHGGSAATRSPAPRQVSIAKD